MYRQTEGIQLQTALKCVLMRKQDCCSIYDADYTSVARSDGMMEGVSATLLY